MIEHATYKRGMLVRIKKGAAIHSLHPSSRGEGRVATRAQIVLLHHTSPGYEGDPDGRYQQDPKVEWAGTGGYWAWTHPDNVEEVLAVGVDMRDPQARIKAINSLKDKPVISSSL